MSTMPTAAPSVLEHAFWQDVFAARRSAIGETVRLNDQACTIVGVMPEGFAFLPPEAPVSHVGDHGPPRKS